MQNKTQTAYLLALFTNTFAFTISFAAWVIFSVLTVPLATEYGLNHFEKGVLVSIPIFLGSVLRFPVGALTDRYGARVTFPAVMLVGAFAALAASFTSSYFQILICGLFLGLVGTSFIVGICSVSERTSLKKKGVALGVFAVGNVGSMLTTLFAPYLVSSYGWQSTFLFYSLFLIATASLYWVFFTFLDKEKNRPLKTKKQNWAVMNQSRPYRFGLYYFITFGGFVAFTLFLPTYYTEIFSLPLKQAGFYTAFFAFVASLVRPFGGFLSDRLGARKTLALCLGVISSAILLMGLVPFPLTLFFILTLLMGLAMGTGSAAVYKYIPQYFPREIGVIGGFVGAMGGLGGFLFPPFFGKCRDLFGGFEQGFILFALMGMTTLLWQGITVKQLNQLELAKV